ncbi:MAG: hypothetical protein IH991_25115 [Planctomycetes bacterium]|nr:hypothetical protein [Planctomycetota bacterium]
MRAGYFLTIAVLLFSSVAVSTEIRGNAAKIIITHDEENFRSKITIKASRSHVSWGDVLRGIARARGFDDDALKGVVPDKSFKISGLPALLVIKALDRALSPHIRLDIVRVKDDGFAEPRLAIQLDRHALLASDRRIRKLLRERAANVLKIETKRTYGLTVERDWKDADRRKNIVVFIHGINSESKFVRSLLKEPQRQRFACATFQYPNDQPIADSAGLLSRELRKLAAKHPSRKVSLVAHSMGGLVSRAVIENPKLDPGNVNQLVMLATPNQGSVLAHFAYGLDIAEHVFEGDLSNGTQLFYESIEDGLAEAADDLCPDSQFIRRLNARKRNSKVSYSIILGAKARFERSHVEFVRRRFTAIGKKNRWVRFLGGLGLDHFLWAAAVHNSYCSCATGLGISEPFITGLLYKERNHCLRVPARVFAWDDAGGSQKPCQAKQPHVFLAAVLCT